MTSSDMDISVRLARIEEKIDAQNALMGERFGGITSRLDALEKSNMRQGERIGKLEGERHHAAGSKAAIMALLTGGGVMGAMLIKAIETIMAKGS